MEPGNAAEWAGAVGTIAAVFAAIGVAWAALNSEEKRNKARGRVIAFRLAPYMVHMRGDVRRARKQITDLKALGIPVPHSAALVEAGGIAVPTQIPQDVFGESWTLPPEIALAVAQLDNILVGHRRLLENMASTLLVSTPEDRNSHLGRVEISLGAIGRLADEVNNYCAKVSDETARKSRALLPVN